MARFSDTRTANAPIGIAWETLQDAAVWGGLLGAAEISDIHHDDEGQLQSCKWVAKIGGSELHGKFKVSDSESRERMNARIKAEEWKGTVAVRLEAGSDQTVIHARLELLADGFTAMLALPVVEAIVGKHFPDRLDELVERIEGG